MKKATEENLKNRFGVRHVDMRVHALLDEDGSGITDRAWMETNVSERNKAKYVMTFFIHSSLCKILRNNNNKKLSDR